MEKQSSLYTVKELLQNDSFLRWKLLRTPEDQLFWENYVRENPQIEESIKEADRIIKTVRLNNYMLSEREAQSIFLSVQNRIQRKKKIKTFCLSLSAVACILLSLLYIDPFISKDILPAPDIVSGILTIPEDEKEIRMITGEGNSLVLEQDADIRYDNEGNIIISGESQEITNLKQETEAVQWNKLIVPKGRRSSLTLADGSRIWINSGSIVEFPNIFEGGKREIKLEGEIYIEVAKDQEKPFYVNTADISVRVLGTRFNISSYNISSYIEDQHSEVVLVEGQVEIVAGKESILLAPDQLASVKNEKIEVKNVNVYDYISWKDGVLRFVSEPLGKILKRLSRYYDIPLSYDSEIENMKCSGKLVLFDDLTDVLMTITNTNPVRFELKTEKEIHISKK